MKNQRLELGILLLLVGVLERLETQIDQGLDEGLVDLLLVPQEPDACLLVRDLL